MGEWWDGETTRVGRLPTLSEVALAKHLPSERYPKGEMEGQGEI